MTVAELVDAADDGSPTSLASGAVVAEVLLPESLDAEVVMGAGGATLLVLPSLRFFIMAGEQHVCQESSGR